MMNDIPAPTCAAVVPSLLIADAVRVFDLPATVAVAREKGQEVAASLAAAGQNNADAVAKILGEASDDSLERLARTAALFGAALSLFENSAQDVIRHNAKVVLASTWAGVSAVPAEILGGLGIKIPEQGIIYFFRQWQEPYGRFSNFSDDGFHLDGFWWRSVEHYFQASRFLRGSDEFHAVRIAATPADTKSLVKKMKRQPSPNLNANFERVKNAVMRRALLEKFKVHADLGRLLVSTGEATLVENSRTDSYWGCGRDGRGRNVLGRMLMKVRDHHLRARR